MAGGNSGWNNSYGVGRCNIDQLYVYLPFDTEIPTLEIYPEDTLPKVTKYIYMELPIASLFVTVKY